MPRVPVPDPGPVVRVPTYDQPQVQARAAPNARQSIHVPRGAFGAGAARAAAQAGQQITGLGDLLAQRAVEIKQENDRTAVKEVETAFLQARRKLTIEGESAFYNQRGRAAVDGYESFSEAMRALAQDYGANLSNDDQRQIWDEIAARHVNAELDKAASHAAAERRVWQTETSEARMATATSEAIAAQSPEERAAARDAVLEEVAAQAALNGWSEEVTDYKRAGALTALHVGVVDRMLAAGQASAARAYYAQHRDEISGDRRADVEESLRTGAIRAQAQAHADAIIDGGGPPSEQMQAARAIEDPDLRDEVVRRVKSRISEQETLREIEQARFLESVYERVAESGSLDAVTPSEEVRLRALGKWGDVRKMTRPGDIDTDWAVWTELRTKSDRDLRELNPLEYRTKLADAEYKQLLTMVRSAKEGDPDGHNTRVRSVNQMVDDTLRVMDIDTTPREGTAAAEKATAFRRDVQGRLAQFETMHERKATPTEIQEIIDRAALEVTTDKGILWDTTKRRYEMTMEDVPVAEREKIIATIERRGLQETSRVLGYPVTEVTEQVVIDLFALMDQPQD